MPAFNEAEILATSVKERRGRSARAGRALRGADRRERLDRRHARDRRRIAAELPEVRVEHRDEPTTAARCAPAAARQGDAVVNFDTDYFDLDFLDAAVASVLAPGGPAIVVGSKRGEGATDTRGRCASSRRGVQHDPARRLRAAVSDTHGIKAMRRAAVEPYRGDVLLGSGPLRHAIAVICSWAPLWVAT